MYMRRTSYMSRCDNVHHLSRYSRARIGLIQELEGWQQKLAINNKEFHLSVVKSAIVIELHKINQEHASTLSKLKLMTKPSKKVFATSKFAKGKLTLVPSALSVTTVAETKVSTMPPPHAYLGTLAKMDGVKIIFSLPQPSPTVMVCPYFYVRLVNDPKDANMHFVDVCATRNVEMDIGDKVIVPRMVNTRAISEDEELCCLELSKLTSPDSDEEGLPAPKRAKGIARGRGGSGGRGGRGK
jgi:hypothetical protein